MDSQLKTIVSVIDRLNERIDNGTLVSEESITGSSNGISLLSLKHHSLLSYIHNLVAITSAQVARSEEDNSTNVNEIRDKAIRNTITDRITLEKGVKGLEAKIAYQIEKVTKAYSKAQEEAKKEVSSTTLSSARNKGNDDDEDEDDDDDKLNYRPNPSALLGRPTSTTSSDPSERYSSASDMKYSAPKISATTPFAKDHESKTGRKQKNATMEEFVKEASSAPIAEPSIGSTIMDSGRGGERTEKERRKQAEIQRFEEDNFTRLAGLSKKQTKRAAKQRQLDAQTKNFFGEDWGFSNKNNSNLENATKRKQKASSVWERTKKRQRKEN